MNKPIVSGCSIHEGLLAPWNDCSLVREVGEVVVVAAEVGEETEGDDVTPTLVDHRVVEVAEDNGVDQVPPWAGRMNRKHRLAMVKDCCRPALPCKPDGIP